MKRKLLFLAALLIFAAMLVVGYTQSSKMTKMTASTQSVKQEQREQRHKEREERRAQRLAEYERYMDSIVLSRNFRFLPDDIQQQPAGPTRMLSNPNFELTVWGSEVDVCLPYIKGVTPPYYFTMLNYTLPYVAGYTTEQTRDGWLVTFSSSLYSATDYHFSLSIYSAPGSATLTITNPWFPDVQYDGTITGI